MALAPKILFDSISEYSAIEEMVNNAEEENIHLECKSPTSTKLNKDGLAQLAKAISGFSNTDGGVMLYGISTTNHAHHNIDVMSQIEPIANIDKFEAHVKNKLPTLTTPPCLKFETKILKKSADDLRGLLLVYIPISESDPTRSLKDSHFYFRSGDEFTIAPYELIKRLFFSSTSPELSASIKTDLCTIGDTFADISIGIRNQSSTSGKYVYAQVIVDPDENVKNVTTSAFESAASINPGIPYSFQKHYETPFYKDIFMNLGKLRLHFSDTYEKKNKAHLIIQIFLYADSMDRRENVYLVEIVDNEIEISDLQNANLIRKAE